MRASHVSPLLGVAALCTLSLSLATPAAAEWRRVDSPNFVVIGDVGAGALREIAVQFEGFRETLSRVLTPRATATAVPTVVIVFPSDRAFTPFKPTFEGKPVDVAGLFVSRRDVNYIALVADNRQDRMRIVFHEYAHLVISNIAQNVPLWLNEGLAEYYSTYEVRRGGREATIGRPLEHHLVRLEEGRLLPLADLLQAGHDSPHYNENDRRSIFYSQSWALTHLILMGEPNRSAELSAFLEKVAQGTPPDRAWQDAFGAANVERELQTYIRRQTFRALQYTFPEKLATVEGTARPLPQADARAFLADFLVQQRRGDEAAARLTAAATLDPSNARALAVAARLDVARGDHASAERTLLGLGEVSDWLVAYAAGTAIAELVEAQGASPGRTHLEAARRFFDIAHRGRPELANALARLAALDVQGVGGPSDETVGAIERARSLAPGRHDYVFLHARILAQRSEFAAARALLGPFLTPAFAPEVREPARRLMGYIVQMESAVSAAASRRGRPAAAAQPSTAASPNRTSSAQPPLPAAFQPIYRQLEPGEHRLEGELERIECLRGGAAIFHLRTKDGPVRAAAPQMMKVDFITYREDVTGQISCGELAAPLPVYVSWRPADADVETKIVVAIEFVK